MTEALKTAIDQAMQLPTGEQDRLARLLSEYVEQFGDARQFENDMKDPAYKAYVEETVASGQADIDAGRTMSADQIRKELKLPR